MGFYTCLLLAVGGGLGTLARFGVGIVALPYSQSLPWGTIVINVVGSFIIGLFGTLTLNDGRFPVAENLRLFVMVGFCGGFTTFSSFSLQTLELLRGGALPRALANVALSVALCLCAVALGHALGAQLNGGAVRITQLDPERDA